MRPTNQKKAIDILADVDYHQKYTHPLSPMPKKLENPGKFKFVAEKTLRQEKLELTRWQSSQLRAKLPKGIYWLQLTKGGSVHWNWTLTADFILNGNGSQHQQLVEEYLATLPQTT